MDKKGRKRFADETEIEIEEEEEEEKPKTFELMVFTKDYALEKPEELNNNDLWIILNEKGEIIASLPLAGHHLHTNKIIKRTNLINLLKKNYLAWAMDLDQNELDDVYSNYAERGGLFPENGEWALYHKKTNEIVALPKISMEMFLPNHPHLEIRTYVGTANIDIERAKKRRRQNIMVTVDGKRIGITDQQAKDLINVRVGQSGGIFNPNFGNLVRQNLKKLGFKPDRPPNRGEDLRNQRERELEELLGEDAENFQNDPRVQRMVQWQGRFRQAFDHYRNVGAGFLRDYGLPILAGGLSILGAGQSDELTENMPDVLENKSKYFIFFYLMSNLSHFLFGKGFKKRGYSPNTQLKSKSTSNLPKNDYITNEQTYEERNFKKGLRDQGIKEDSVDDIYKWHQRRGMGQNMLDLNAYEQIQRINEIEGKKRNQYFDERVNHLTGPLGPWNESYVPSEHLPKPIWHRFHGPLKAPDFNKEPLRKVPLKNVGQMSIKSSHPLDWKYPRFDRYVDPRVSSFPSNSFFFLLT